MAHEYVSAVRTLLTYEASVGGSVRYLISPADLSMMEGWARVSTIASALSGSEFVSTAIFSHASAPHSRAVILELIRKQHAPSAASKSSSPSPGRDLRDQQDVWYRLPPRG